MLEQLPKLFDRNFILGFFVPVTLFLVLGLAILYPLPAIEHLLRASERDPSLSLIVVLLIIVILSYMLISINVYLIRFLEGYYFLLRSIPWLKVWHKNRRQSIEKKIKRIERSWKSLEQGDATKFATAQFTRSHQLEMLTNYYPEEEHLILPTRFGNVIRAFEAYPRIMYGLDAIAGWPRLIRVMAQNSEEQVSSSKSVLDYYRNLFYLSLLVLPLIIIRLFHDMRVFSGDNWMQFAFRRWWQPVVFLAALLVAWILYRAAVAAALGWGVQVKASFDVHIEDLGKRLGYKPPISHDQWQQISQCLIYNIPLPVACLSNKAPIVGRQNTADSPQEVRT